MLSKKQKLLMKVIYSHAIRKEGVCLIRTIDLLKEIPLSSDFRRDELESNLKALVTEDFFEMITTDKKGEEYYCFTLHQNGYAFSRQIAAEKRAIVFKLILTVCGAILSFTLVRILTAIAG